MAQNILRGGQRPETSTNSIDEPFEPDPDHTGVGIGRYAVQSLSFPALLILLEAFVLINKNAICLSVAMGLVSGPVCAQEDQEAGELEEILVTAQFRETSLMETTGSISVVQPVTLFDRGAVHLQDVLNVLPNVSFSSGGSRARFVQIRGIGDLEQFVDPKYFPSVGITMDDVDMGGLASAALLLDTRQIEVLRGPQGTRFGTNALAGMINIQSNDPSGQFEGYAQAGVGNYGLWNVAAAVGGPLSDQFQGRLAVSQNSSDGYIYNDYLKSGDSSRIDEFSARGKLRWLGEGNTYADLTVLWVDIENGYDAWSLDSNRHTLSDRPGVDQQQAISIAAKIYWEIHSTLALETIISWSDTDTQYSYDEDWTNPGVCDGFEFCYPYSGFDYQDRQRNNISLDSHLISLNAGDFNWVLGAYAQYRDEDFTRDYYGTFQSHYETQRYALYSQINYDFASNWQFIGGLRLETFSDQYNDSNALRSKTDDQYLTGELTLQYLLDSGNMLYGTVSRGVKPGGINTEASSVFYLMDPGYQDFMQNRLQFGNETLVNFEVGFKGQFLNDKLEMRAAAFYMQRSNAQLESWIWDDINFIWVGYLDSVAKGTNQGLELELNYSPSERIELFAKLGLLKTNVNSISVVDLGPPGEWTQSSIVEINNRDQTKSPRWQYNVGGNVYLTDGLSAQLEVEGRDDSYYGYYHNQKTPDFALFNASIGYQTGNVNIRLWGRNLADKTYAVHGLYFANDPRKDYVNEAYLQLGEPRVFGIEVKYSFY